ncbi:hypothetical protein OH491_21950 [Termitidicoccus mucosus]|uniref:Uncharacterized protein n=1 Tax=Termitidicoccus mucosus TaxID=1184151 RepID=A0A178IF13_9BACT|nr:hypothetical protein AW736_21775 [Opitutaceae bacterium TSB47]
MRSSSLRFLPGFRPSVPGLLLGLLISAAALRADAPASCVIVVPVESQRLTPTAIALVQPADYVCATIEVTSRRKDTAGQVADIRETIDLLAKAVDKSPRLSLHTGPLRFSSAETITARPLYPAAGGAPWAFSNFSKSSADPFTPARFVVRILWKIAAADHDTLDASATIRQFADTFKPAGQAEVRLARLALAVESPERQRQRLLQLIGDSADAMKKTFAASAVSIDGLEGPVLVRQVDDTQVELFIDYKLSVKTGS